MSTFEGLQAEIQSMLDTPDELLTDEQRAAMDEYLDFLGKAESDKVDGFAQFCRLQDAACEALKEEGKRLAARAKTMENRLARLKFYYLQTMGKYGLNKVSGSVYTISTRKSQSVEVVNIEALPAEFVRVKTETSPDKTKIMAALKAGQEVAGARVKVSETLQIK